MKQLSDILEPFQAAIILNRWRSDPEYIPALKRAQAFLRDHLERLQHNETVRVMYFVVHVHAELQKLESIDEDSPEYGNALYKWLQGE